MTKYPLVRLCADGTHQYEPYSRYDLHEVCQRCGLVKLEDKSAPLETFKNQFVYLGLNTPEEKLVVIFVGSMRWHARILRALARYTSAFSVWVFFRYGRIDKDIDSLDSWFENMTVEYPNG